MHVKFNVKILFILSSIVLAIPSIIYLIKNKTILYFSAWFTYFLREPTGRIESIWGMLIFGLILISLMILYLSVLKIEIFRNIKQILLFITIISAIFTITLPFTTSDVFHYMGVGWIDYSYDENPYYTSVKDVREENENDEILVRTGVWEGEKLTYGPLWAIICKILASFSLGNATLCLYVFKLMSLIVHILNCILIYRITRKNVFVLMYGLNPFILFEGLSNVHNDLYVITFLLISLYFLLKRKNIVLAVVFIALATAIKYVSVLLAPFLVLYYFKNEKPIFKTIYSVLCAFIFLIVLGLCYSVYIRDSSIFFSMVIQQDKYRESILFLIILLFKFLSQFNLPFDILKIFYILKTGVLILFIVLYVSIVIKYIFINKYSLSKTLRDYHKLLFVFVFLIITNLCPWYLMWFFPTLFWQRKESVKTIIYIAFAYEICTLYNFAFYSEAYTIGILYLPTIYLVVKLLKDLEISQLHQTIEKILNRETDTDKLPQK